jgi:hypothetical protein
LCGPGRKAKANQVRKVLRVTLKDDGFAIYNCPRCLTQGYAFADGPTRRKPIERPIPNAEPDPHPLRQTEKARWMWSIRRQLSGSPAETYLRSRGIRCDLPSTLGFLPARKPDHHPAMIAAFYIPDEPEPGVLHVRENSFSGVHLTLLKPDGSGKAGTERDKIMVGPSAGSPIVLAPPNDGLGLVIAEGIETALSVHQATGLGAWAAGSAGRMPQLADVVPAYLETVVIAAENDAAGLRGVDELIGRLNARGIEVTMMEVSDGV